MKNTLFELKAEKYEVSRFIINILGINTCSIIVNEDIISIVWLHKDVNCKSSLLKIRKTKL